MLIENRADRLCAAGAAGGAGGQLSDDARWSRLLPTRWGPSTYPRTPAGCTRLPIPRLGGLAIFIGFMVSILLFVEITPEMRSILLGAVIIVVLGVVDDIMALPAMLKFVVQIVAALIPATHGVVIQAFSNPNVFSDNPYWVLGRSVHALYGALDRGHHQRREPDRRPGRPGQRRLRHLRHHHAGHRPGRRASARWPW